MTRALVIWAVVTISLMKWTRRSRKLAVQAIQDSERYLLFTFEGGPFAGAPGRTVLRTDGVLLGKRTMTEPGTNVHADTL